MTTTDITTGNLKVNFYPNLSTFSSISNPSNYELHAVPFSSNISQNYRSGHSWYRVWSDGCIEQGGVTSSFGAYITITFAKPYSNTNYSVFMSTQVFSSSGYLYITPSLHTSSPKATSSFKACYYEEDLSVSFFWRAIGY